MDIEISWMLFLWPEKMVFQDFLMTPNFWNRRMEVERNLILAALPGAQRREGASPQGANIVNDS